ncbi:E3 SUMO-protein ligase ZBED1-like [Bombina bombina]|uniref:E3 SUMO-protein ligase ZBED1-like n=1 Tax=Bombina bombina TaxID=8345 RepID=UPI00235AC0D9|nr:E3 SUMO-protein ligase ZBED1-like [Bombina bombina]
MRPLSMVEGKGFKNMVSVLNPGYTLPSRTHFTKLVERKYQEALKNVKGAISAAANESRIALTADIWTSIATEAYLGITCHYIGADWKMHSICLTTMPLEDRHTAKNIAEWLEEVAAKFEIQPQKIIAIVHDNGLNIVAAANILGEKHGWTSIRCSGHTLQLVINAALKNSGIERAVSAARGLVEHFKKSELPSSKLKEKQKQMGTSEHKLLQDVSTRWNNTYYMVERLIEQRWPVTAALSDPSVTQRGKHYLDLKPDQWSILEELSTALKPFEFATVYMSGQEYVTLSSVPALVKGLLRSNEGASFESHALKSFQATAADQLQNRWKGILFEQVPNSVILASALDPRFRRLKFLTTEQIITVHAKVQTEALAVRREMVRQQNTVTPGGTVAEPSTSATSLLDSLLESGGSSEEETIEGQHEEDINLQVRNEVQTYFAEKPLAKEGNPLSWWKGNQEKYPALAKLAKSYLCIPGTSTPSERLFSAAGNITSKKRASLGHVNIFIF